MTASAKEVIARSLCVADGNDPDGDFRECGPVFLTVAVDHPERWRTRIREADAILAALDAAGLVVVPREPTEADAVTKRRA